MLNRCFLTLLVVFFLCGVASSAVIPLFPTYVEGHLHRSALLGANLRFLFFLLGGLSAVPAGALCDSFGRKRTLVIGLTGALSAGLLFLTGDPLVLYLLCIHAGLTVGVQSVAGQTYLMGAVDAKHLGIASALFFMATNLGNTIGSPLSGMLAKAHGYFTLGTVLTAIALVSWLGAAFVLPTLPHPAKTCSFKNVWNWTSYRRLLRRREVWYLLGIRFLPTCYWGAMTFTVPLLMSRLSHYDPRVPANYQMVYLFVAMGCQFFTGWLCDRIGRKIPVLVSSSLVALSALLLTFSTQSLPALYLLGVMTAAAAWSLSTTMPGIINHVAGSAEKGRLMSLTHVAWSVAMATGTWGAGRLVDGNPALIFAVAAGMCAVAMLCGWRLIRHASI
ncbi:MAG: MFS transporter [Abditibacteriales bacterium]|nr:MFS transporter [Abditibacteriales bacterium]MDW8367482.1 MFS transporter [Abditibacteriales bacterium]